MEDMALDNAKARLREISLKAHRQIIRDYRKSLFFVVIAVASVVVLVAALAFGWIGGGKSDHIVSMLTAVWSTAIGYYFGSTRTSSSGIDAEHAVLVSNLIEEIEALESKRKQARIFDELVALRNEQDKREPS
jgi:hypothetical protein